MWQPGPPATDLALSGAQLLATSFRVAVPSASRCELGRCPDARAEIVPATFASQPVGGQDELISRATALVIDDEGTVLARAPGFEEALVLIDIEPSAVVTRSLTETRRRAARAGARGPFGTVQIGPTSGGPHEQKDTVERPGAVRGRSFGRSARARVSVSSTREEERIQENSSSCHAASTQRSCHTRCRGPGASAGTASRCRQRLLRNGRVKRVPRREEDGGEKKGSLRVFKL